MLYTLKDLRELVNDYKTNSSKKAFLTREIKAMREHYSDLKKAYENRKKGNSYGWYLGQKVFSFTVREAERNILIIEKFRNENF